jgi:hypothetical protein
MSTSKEIQRTLEYVFNNNKQLAEKNRPPVALEVIGPAGIGKTSVIIDFCKDNDLDHAKINLAQMDELAELIGWQVREFKTVDGEWINEKQTELNTVRLTSETRTSWCPPKWVPTDTKGGILILDDWNRADPRFTQAVMELIDRGEYISWKMPKNWTIVLTSNPDNGDYSVNTVDPAQRTRYLTLEMSFNHKDWAAWAEFNNIDSRCINFVLMNPEIINNKKVNPRAATKFFDVISSIKEFSTEMDFISTIGHSLGDEFITCFVLAIQNRQDKIIDIQDFFELPFKEVVARMNDCTNFGKKNYKSSVGATIITRMVNYLAKLNSENKITKSHYNRLSEFCANQILPKENYSYLLKEIATIDNPITDSIYKSNDQVFTQYIF